MKIEISEEIIIAAIASNYNISENCVDLKNYAQRQILESIEYYLRYGNGRLHWNRNFNGGIDV